MFNSRWVFMLALVSFSSFGGVSFQEKKMRVDSLMKLKLHAPGLSFDAYNRELEYELQGLSNEVRANKETNLLADKMRQQISLAYEAALKEHENSDIARAEVQNAIESDLELASPRLKDELKLFAADTLNSIETGTSQEVQLLGVEQTMLKQVESRQEFLNTDGNLGADPINPKANTSKDSERKEYATRAELMSSLVSDRESSRWVSTSNQTLKTADAVKVLGSLSLQVKVEFLGASLEAGPSISFSRNFTTNATILAEGLEPFLLKNGDFDLTKRDDDYKVIYKNGKAVTRYVSFYCDAELNFSTEYEGAGGFKFMGIGADASVSKTVQQTVNLQSRRIALPEVVANKLVTAKYLTELCHNDYLKAKVTKVLSIEDSLNIMMKNFVSSLIFSHPKTKCMQDYHCGTWLYTDVVAHKRANNKARCIENPKEKYRTCELRGLAGQACYVLEKGKLISSGVNEYLCDKGLKCVKYAEPASMLNFKMAYAKGRCAAK